MTKTHWIIFAVISALALFGIATLAQKEKIDVTNVDPAKIITDGDYPDHVLGQVESEVVLIEYGDFQCPGCQGVAAPLKDLVTEYDDQIAFTYRNMPLTSIHPNALAAAAAAEAADLQGKYWEMHQLLFERQDAWGQASIDSRNSFFEGYASELGLDVEKFKADMISDQVTQRIARDRALSEKVGAESTPTLILNGEVLGEDVLNDLSRGDGQLIRDKLNQVIEATGGTPPQQD